MYSVKVLMPGNSHPPPEYHLIQNVSIVPNHFKFNSNQKLRTPSLIKLETNGSHNVTYMIMSGLVALFINVIFGSIAVVCSIHSFHLLKRFDLVNAKKWGRIAFTMNVLGILSTMLLIILVFRLKFSDKNVAN